MLNKSPQLSIGSSWQSSRPALALVMLVAPVAFKVAPVAFAETSTSYAENGTDPVLTLQTPRTQDGDPIVWSPSGGPDKGPVQHIDGGRALRFKSLSRLRGPEVQRRSVHDCGHERLQRDRPGHRRQ